MAKTNPGTPPSGGAGKKPGTTKKPSSGKKNPKGTASNNNGGKGDGNQVIYVQPPFDPKTLAIPFPMQGGAKSDVSQKIKKGYMEWDKNFLPSAYSAAKKPAVVNFQYNPSTTSYSSSNVGTAAQMAQAFSDPSTSSILTTPMNQTISFDLLYNRIYEVQGAYKGDGTPKKSGSGVMDPANHGCWVDILAMEQFTGQLSGDNGAGKNNTPGPPEQNKVNTNIVYQGPSFIIRSWLILGADDTALYYGYVSDWNYQIAAWTQFMIPMTCVISVTFTLLPYNAAQQAPPGNDQWSLIPPGLPKGNSGGAGHRVHPGPPGQANPTPTPGGNSGKGGR